MKHLICIAVLLAVVRNDAFSQRSNAGASEQYAFIMVINKEGTKLYFSPVFSFKVDQRGNPECDIGQLEVAYRKKVADEKFDVITSDHFESKEEADMARGVYIDSEKRAGRTVEESGAEVVACSD